MAPAMMNAMAANGILMVLAIIEESLGEPGEGVRTGREDRGERGEGSGMGQGKVGARGDHDGFVKHGGLSSGPARMHWCGSCPG